LIEVVEGAGMGRFPVRWAVVTVVVLAIAGLGYWGVNALSKDQSKGELVMAIKPVTKGDIEVTVRGWGQLQATEERAIVSGATGVIKDVLFEPGQSVRKGQVLATIEPGSLSVSLKTSEIELETKRVALAKSFGVPMDQVATVNPEIALTVRAPMSGRVMGLTASVGSDASGKICSVVDDSRLLIKLQLPQYRYDVVHVGTKVVFRANRFEGGIEGVVSRCDPNPIKGDTGYLYEVWVGIANPGLLKVGDEGSLTFEVPGDDFRHDGKVTSYGSEQAAMSAVFGKVKTLYARDGMVVQKGDPILEFEPGDALLSAMTLQLGVKKLMIEVEDLRLQLQSLSIVSPIDGVAIVCNVTPGQQVSKGTQVSTVSNFTKMDLMLRVDEMDVPKVQPGQQASVYIWGPQGRQAISATVSRLGATGDPRDGMSAFNITLAVVNPGYLRPGMGGEAQIFVSKKQNVILCPVEAVYKEDEKWFVDLKEGKDRKPVEIQVGAMNDKYAEIIQGLTEGQEVVVGMTKQQPTTQPGRNPSSPIPMPIKGR
jgi:multidrug efflux pump subunit AcrA (membrane-fusion protein)